MNKATFSTPGRGVISNAVNAAGGTAHLRSNEEALAQAMVTGTANDGYYTTGEAQVEEFVRLAKAVPVEFLARAVVYGRRKGRMRDMPILGLAVLSTRDPKLTARIFPHVVDTVKQARNLVQVVGSGKAGRKGLGTTLKRGLQKFLVDTNPEMLFRKSSGQSPTLGFVVKLAHPKPKTETQRTLFKWLMGQPVDDTFMPHSYFALKNFAESHEPGLCPPLSFELLAPACKSPMHWYRMAEVLSWDALRRNLNTLARQGVFDIPGATATIAAKLRDPDENAMPMAAFTALSYAEDMPKAVREALHDAAERATKNVPALAGKVLVAVDVSGSMSGSLTGYRKGATSKLRLVDAAAVFGVSIWRRADATLVAVDTTLHLTKFEPRDTVMTVARSLAQFGGGGTNLELVAEYARGKGFDVVYLVSDNESWMHRHTIGERLKDVRKLIVHDLTPNATTQAPSMDGRVLNVGGASDAVFETIQAFVEDRASWLDLVNATEIPA